MPLQPGPIIVIALLAAGLGTPLRQDGYTIRPPQGFRLAKMDLFHGTRAGAVAALGEDGERSLSAALVDGEGTDAATMLVAVVGRPFDATPSNRDAFTTAAMKHFADELGMPLTLVRSDLQGGPSSKRVEVVGTLKQQDQLRTIVLAAMEGDPRHAVVTFSVPSARFDALWPDLRASLDSFRADPPPGAAIPTSAVWTIAVALVLALFASWRLWRRRARLRRADQGLPG